MSERGNGDNLSGGGNPEAREQPRTYDIAPDGSMIARPDLTQQQPLSGDELAAAYHRLFHSPRIIRIGSGSLFVELKIEAGNGSGSGSGSGAEGPADANNNSSSSEAAGEGSVQVQPQSAGPAETREHIRRCPNNHPRLPRTGNPAAATAGSGPRRLSLGQASNAPRFPDPQPSNRQSANTSHNQIGDQPQAAAAAVVAAAGGPPPPANYFQNHNLAIRPRMEPQPRPGVLAGNQMIDRMAINLRPYLLPGPANPNPNPQGDLPMVAVQAPPVAGIDGQLNPMPLDIEEMAYEEILALEEQIGNVNTGLSEEVIMQRLPRRYYRVPRIRPPEHPDLCSICLVEFVSRDVLGRIMCTHKYHFECIKQWLMQKNFCPVCKRTAVLVPRRQPNNNN